VVGIAMTGESTGTLKPYLNVSSEISLTSHRIRTIGKALSIYQYPSLRTYAYTQSVSIHIAEETYLAKAKMCINIFNKVIK